MITAVRRKTIKTRVRRRRAGRRLLQNTTTTVYRRIAAARYVNQTGRCVQEAPSSVNRPSVRPGRRSRRSRAPEERRENFPRYKPRSVGLAARRSRAHAPASRRRPNGDDGRERKRERAGIRCKIGGSHDRHGPGTPREH